MLTSPTPVPSRLISSSTLLSEVVRVRRRCGRGCSCGTLLSAAGHGRGTGHGGVLGGERLGHGGQEGVGLGGGPGRDTKIVRDPTSRTRTPRSSSACQCRPRRAGRRRGRSWRRWAPGRGPAPPGPSTMRSRCALITATVEHLRCVAGRQRDGLCRRRQVVRQAHQAQHVGQRRVRGEVAQRPRRTRTPCSWSASRRAARAPRAGSGRWACPPARTRRTPRRRRPRRPEPRRRPPPPPRATGRCRSGLFGEQRKTTLGRCSRTCATADSAVRSNGASVPAAQAVDPGRAEGLGDDRVHRVGRGEPERDPAGPTERLQQVLQHLVGAVAGPHLVSDDVDPEVVVRYAARAARSSVNSRSGYG